MNVQHLNFAELPRESLLGGTWQRVAFRGDDSLVTVNWMDPAMAPQPEHHHDFDQVSMVLEGSMQFTVEGEPFLVESGQVLIIPAGARHTGIAVGVGKALNIDVYAPPRPDYLYLTAHQDEARKEGGSVSQSDIIEIDALLTEWAHCLDLGEPSGILALLADGATVTGLGPEPRDREGMTGWLETRSESATRRTRHHLSNLRCSVDESGTIRATAYVLLFVTDSLECEPPTLQFQGQYEDEIVRTPEGLRFLSRSIVPFGEE